MITTRSLRKYAAAAALTVGMLAPAQHAFAASQPARPSGPGGITAPTTPPVVDPGPTTPPTGPGDITSPLPGGDPTPCNPILASCNITSNPGGGNGGGGNGSGTSDPTNPADAGVDQAVVANPTFTG